MGGKVGSKEKDDENSLNVVISPLKFSCHLASVGVKIGHFGFSLIHKQVPALLTTTAATRLHAHAYLC